MIHLRRGSRVLERLAPALLCLVVACGGSAAGRGAETHNATYVSLVRGDTTFIERVQDVPDGFAGEITMPDGAIWIRYRVWVGPQENVSRIDLAMTSMVGSSPGDEPTPMLSARREGNSVVIEPAARNLGFPARRVEADPSVLLTLGPSMSGIEQTLRRARRLGTGKVRLSVVEAMSGRLWDATCTPRGRDATTMTVGPETWELTLDASGHIREARYGLKPGVPGFRDLVVHRVDGRTRSKILRPIALLFDSAGQIGTERPDPRWAHLEAAEAEFRRTVREGDATAIRVAVEPAVDAMALRGGAYQSMLCSDASAALLAKRDKVYATRYAHRAVDYADHHDVRSFGDQGLLPARIVSRRALAEALFALAGHGHAPRIGRARASAGPAADAREVAGIRGTVGRSDRHAVRGGGTGYSFRPPRANPAPSSVETPVRRGH